MKILFFSDLHARKLYRSLSAEGVIEDVLKTIAEIHTVAKANNVDCIYSLGDLFHKVGTVSVELIARVYLAFHEISKDFPTHFLVGNHDISGKYTILEPFAPFGSVISSPEMRKHGAITFFCYPYTTGTYMFEEADYLLGHLSLSEGELDSTDLKLKEEMSIEELKDYYPSGGFLGHYHCHQHVGRGFYYLGSAIQLSFGERDQEKFCLVFDTKTQELEWVELTAARKYSIIQLEEGTVIDPEMVENRIIKFVVSGNLDPKAVIELAGENSECIIERTAPPITITHRLNPKATLVDTIKEYIGMVETDLSRAKLIEIGSGIVENYKGKEGEDFVEFSGTSY